MYVVPEADITMYARGMLGRHGPLALRYARDQAARLARIKDEEGAVVWARVADAVAARLGQRAAG